MSLSRLLTLALLMVSLVGLAGCSSKGDIDETAAGGAAAGMGGQGGASSYGAGAGVASALTAAVAASPPRRPNWSR